MLVELSGVSVVLVDVHADVFSEGSSALSPRKDSLVKLLYWDAN